MRHPLIIAFEGLDGAGKTTACEELSFRAGQLGFTTKIIKTPGPLSSPLAFSLRQSASISSLLSFAIGNLEAVSAHSDIDAIFVDRYMLSTLVHHATAFQSMPDAILGTLKALNAPTPLLTVFLDAPAELARERLSKRSLDRALLVPLEEQRARFCSMLVDTRLDFLIGTCLTQNTASYVDLNNTTNEILRCLSSSRKST